MPEKIVAYARVSSREQAEDTNALEQQKARLRAAGATEIFVDVESGTNDARPKLKELMDLVAAGQVNKVIATRMDRVARSLPKLRQVIDVFQESGVNLVILDQHLDLTTAQGRMMVNILGSLAEWETDLLSERTRHGMQHRRNQEVACPQAPWGYKVAEKKYVLDRSPFLCLMSDRPENYLDLKGEDVVLEQLPGRTIDELARESIDIYLEEKSIRRTLAILFNKYGIKKTKLKTNSTQKIFHWTSTGFFFWLKNPILRGHTAYLKRDNIKNRRINKDPKDWLILKDTHSEERLITDEEFEEIEYIFELSAKIGNGHLGTKASDSNHYRDYAYQAGHIFCGECGSKCTVKTLKPKGKQYSYYACRHSKAGCSNCKSVKREDIEAALIQNLVKQSKLLAENGDQLSVNTLPKSDRLQELEAKLAAMEKIPGFDPEIELLKEKFRQQIEEEVHSSAYNPLTNQTTEEIIRGGNNLTFWHTLSNDEKVNIFPRLVSKIFIRNGEVESIVFKVQSKALI
ncbi:fdxN element excision recombinase XisF [Microcoleus sp. herbarium7]|uniref:fdxN element excision recombinase XisF n=1 Tax=Microcoleus sp. herbarium7 TaxID=3055435 RepID=UPI002FD14865